MAITKGIVEKKASNGNGILVNGDWYNAYQGRGLASVTDGTEVQIEWDFDKKSGKYRNIKTIAITAHGAAPVHTPSTTSKPYSNIGVELGHASKLAMEMACNHFEPSEVGSTDFYKFWLTHTDKVFKAMKAMRDKAQAGDAKKVQESENSDEELDPLF